MNILVDGQTLHTPEINRGIGTYFKNMLEENLRQDFCNDFFINVENTKVLNRFSEFVYEKIIPIKNDISNPDNLHYLEKAEANEKYSYYIKSILHEYDIDIYWNPNPLMVNVNLPENTNISKHFATLYDAIPYVFKNIYFSQWSDNIKRDYLKRLEVLRSYDKLFSISDNTKNDFIRLFAFEGGRIVNTFCGTSEKFKPYPFPAFPNDGKYILYLGGFDPRKNMYRAIEAFSLFYKNYNIEKSDYKFYIVCSFGNSEKNEIENLCKKLNIANRVILTGFIDEDELVKLYQKASCFFFPSLYEGFGLPVLEALCSGIPVACANNSSLLEVAGNYAKYFDAENVKEMAEALSETLKESNNLEKRQERFKYAAQFTWSRSARVIVRSINNTICETRKKRIAWVSPFPPAKTGIANYSKILVNFMKDHIDIDLYYDEIEPEKNLFDKFNCIPLRKLPSKFKEYDEVIYHIGNNTDFHANIYKYAWDYPSTVVLHDWNIHPFMHQSFYHTKDDRYYKEALKIYGHKGEDELINIKINSYPDVWKLPMSDAIVEKSKRVIVHHRWVKKQLVFNKNVEVIPLFSFVETEPDDGQIKSFKSKYDISESQFIISSFGDVNLNKCPEILIEAVKKIIDEGYPVKMIFAGKIQPETRCLFDDIEKSKYEDYIIATDYLSDIDYYNCLYASDIVINLRNPSMGEGSLTLMQSLFAGKPTIIGNLNQYKEFPDEIVAGKINYGQMEAEQLSDIIKNTLEKPEHRGKIGYNAKKYASETLNINNIIRCYLKQQ